MCRKESVFLHSSGTCLPMLGCSKKSIHNFLDIINGSTFPWKRSRLYNNDRRREYYLASSSFWRSADDVALAIESLDLTEYHVPADGSFIYPADKPRNAHHTLQMQRVEGQLDLIWTKIDEQLDRSPRYVRGVKTFLDFSDRVLERTPDWVPRTQFRSPPFQETGHFIDSFASCSVEPSPGKRIPRAVKAKTKTRKSIPLEEPQQQQTPPHSVNASETTSEDAIKQETIKLKERDLKIFHYLFYNPAQGNTPRNIDFADFLHAMGSSGFTFEKLGGSAWQFTPNGMSVRRSISFHEPHPDSRIPFFLQRQFGRRLQRAYGWGRDNFIAE